MARKVEVSWSVGDLDVLARFSVSGGGYSGNPYEDAPEVELLDVREDAVGAEPREDLADAIEKDPRFGRLQDRAVASAIDDSAAEYDDACEREAEYRRDARRGL
jgi:hypothetical protein